MSNIIPATYQRIFKDGELEVPCDLDLDNMILINILDVDDSEYGELFDENIYLKINNQFIPFNIERNQLNIQPTIKAQENIRLLISNSFNKIPC